jgi:hypothetical protein
MCAANKTSGGALREGARCIASECMAWRVAKSVIVQQTLGYCGLAGDPQSKGD